VIVTYDTEFLEDGKTIELISFGMVTADDRELYYVNADADFDRILDYDFAHDEWLLKNVLEKLPHTGEGITWELDHGHPSVLSKAAIAHDVEEFLGVTEDPELWAYYSATDHVVGYQLFGSMMEANRWHGWPMRTSCLKQEELTLKRVGVIPENWSPPRQDPATAHHALWDAMHDMDRARALGLVS
jgi:hypothetical protein